MRVINLIVVHCSATKADRDFTEQDLEVCHRRRGMNGPGYHFYIRKNGDIKTTRPIEKIGAHARGYNAQSIGICYEGGVSERGRPAASRMRTIPIAPNVRNHFQNVWLLSLRIRMTM